MVHRKTFIEFDGKGIDLIQYLKGIMDDARATTLQRIEGIAVQELDWQYAPGWNTIGALLSHIIACESTFPIFFLEERDLNPDEEAKWGAGLKLGPNVPSLITGKPIEKYIQELEMSRKNIFEKLDKLKREDFIKKREGYDPITGHNLAWTLYHQAEDEVHHRGQISLLRKLYTVNIKGAQRLSL
jgi:uncharacterized damage-inducible protein DinB